MFNLITITPSGTQRGDVSGIPEDVLSASAPVIAAAEAGAPAILAGVGAPYSSELGIKSGQETQKIETATMAANKELILSALKAAGIKSVEVEYEGDGDSGGVVDTTFYYSPGCEKDPDEFSVYLIRSEYALWAKEPSVSIYLRRCDLRNAIQEFAECDVVDYFGHSGYENNDGGRGTVTFDVEKGSITLEHSDFIMSTEDYDHEF